MPNKKSKRKTTSAHSRPMHKSSPKKQRPLRSSHPRHSVHKQSRSPKASHNPFRSKRMWPILFLLSLLILALSPLILPLLLWLSSR